MNEQIDNSSPLSLSQALELIKTREGENFSKEKVNLAELQRLTGITRGKLRRLRTRGLSPLIRVSDGNPFSCDMHPKKVTVLKVTGVELVTLSYF